MDNQDKEERRKYERFLFREDILIDGTRMCTSMDISEIGLYVSAMQSYENNSVIDIRAQYCFKIPDVFKKDYDLFVEGRYSEFSQKAKDVILNFSNKFYPHSSQTIQNICKILNKDVSLQESLEKKLGVSSGSIFELSSKVDLVHETYNYTK